MVFTLTVERSSSILSQAQEWTDDLIGYPYVTYPYGDSIKVPSGVEYPERYKKILATAQLIQENGLPPFQPQHIRWLLSKPGSELWGQATDSLNAALWSMGQNWVETDDPQDGEEKVGQLRDMLWRSEVAPFPDGETDMTPQAFHKHLQVLVDQRFLRKKDGTYSYSYLHRHLENLDQALEADNQPQVIGTHAREGLLWGHPMPDYPEAFPLFQQQEDPRSPLLFNFPSDLDPREEAVVDLVGDLALLIGDLLQIVRAHHDPPDLEAVNPAEDTVDRYEHLVQSNRPPFPDQIEDSSFLCLDITPSPYARTEEHGEDEDTYREWLEQSRDALEGLRDEIRGDEGELYWRFDPRPD